MAESARTDLFSACSSAAARVLLCPVIFLLFTIALPADQLDVSPELETSGITLSGPEGPLVSGLVTFEAELDPELTRSLAYVAFYLDGRLVGRSPAAPHRFQIDLGPELVRHRLSAVAFGSGAVRLAETSYQTEGLSVAYRDRVSLVVVPTTVLDPRGFFRTDFERADFGIIENGVEQELVCFSSEVVPARIALLLDMSKSMAGKVDETRKAARRLIDLVSPLDQVSVFAFNDRLGRLCDFTGDRKKSKKVLKDVRPSGGTALYDSLFGTIVGFRGTEGKRVLILFTDGKEELHIRPSAARRRLKRALDAAARENVTVYTIGLGQQVERAVLEEIAQKTGGAFFPLDQVKELTETYARIFEELGSQYTLCYRPPAPGAGGQDENDWRRIEVKVRDGEGLIVRHKRGYFPTL